MSAQIFELFLQGFQVFDQPTRIPLARLTLLFGPNSAGKSSIEDALQIVSEIFSHPNGQQPFDTFPQDRLPRLRRDWRRLQDDPANYVENMTVGITYATEMSLHGAFLGYLGDVPKSNDASDCVIENVLESIVSFRLDLSDADSCPARDLHLSISRQPIAEMREFQRIGINFNHVLLRELIHVSDFALLAKEEPDLFGVEDGWIWIKGEGVRVTASKHFDTESFAWDRESFLSRRFTSQAQKAMTEFAHTYDAVTDFFLAQTPGYRRIVPASRQIPSARDLVFLCDPRNHPFSNNLDEEEAGVFVDNWFLIATGDKTYQTLADSFASSLARTSDCSMRPTRPSMAQSVNDMLVGHLFVDRGYRISFDHRVVITPAEFSDLSDGVAMGAEPANYLLLLRIFLEDAQGRRFSFDEVGSGLGYVLPVLCAIGDSAGLVMLQQPELHLHPALQAALGDCLITSSSDKQLLVETHSEHVLLRMLKRIRQTASENPPVHELRLSQADVSVLYFEPTPDGVSQVKRLRVTRGGDFMDRWPRGFFEERDRELFDE